MPRNAVYCGRPSKYSNPYDWRRFGRVKAKMLFQEYVEIAKPFRAEIKRELKGKILVCWCPLDKPCHVDILLKIANE